MARLVAAFGSSHSPMLASRVEDWQSGFLARDQARQFVDFDGNACDYDDTARARAGGCAAADRARAPGATPWRGDGGDGAAARRRGGGAAGCADRRGRRPGGAVPSRQHAGDRHLLRRRRSAAGCRTRRRSWNPTIPATPTLARHLIASLQQDGFDLSVMRSLAEGQREGHAYLLRPPVLSAGRRADRAGVPQRLLSAEPAIAGALHGAGRGAAACGRGVPAAMRGSASWRPAGSAISWSTRRSITR